MNTAAEVVAAARGEIGYTENPPGSNCNKFAVEAGLKNCTFWCGAYTSAILIREQVTVPKGVLTLSTRANLAAWKKAGKWVEPDDIQAGDVVFEHVSDRNGSDLNVPSHTEFATGPFHDGRLPTVGGNTSSDEHGSQDNGGGVFKKSRPRGVVIGAGRPDYQTSPPDTGDDDVRLAIYYCTDHGNSQDGPFFVSDGASFLRNITHDNAIHGHNLGQYGEPQAAPHPYLENIRNNETAPNVNIPGTI